MLAALVPAVAEPPELFRLKCTGYHHKGNTGSNALQTEQSLVCRVTSRYNHRFWIEQAYPARRRVQRYYNHNFYITGIVVITNQFKVLITEPNLKSNSYTNHKFTLEFKSSGKVKHDIYNTSQSIPS